LIDADREVAGFYKLAPNRAGQLEAKREAAGWSNGGKRTSCFSGDWRKSHPLKNFGTWNRKSSFT
jgi:hypothetical protein